VQVVVARVVPDLGLPALACSGAAVPHSTQARACSCGEEPT
jgi:hypothetical protein